MAFPRWTILALAFSIALAGCAADAPDAPASPTVATPTPEAEGEGERAPEFLDCPDPATTEPSEDLMGYPQLTYTVTENDEATGCYSFVGPAKATEGWTAITFENNGEEPHIMPMFFIGERGMADVMQAMQAEGEPDWIERAGAVGFVSPGVNGTAIVHLKPGNYLMICWLDGHFMKGMHRILTVTAAEEGAILAPEPNATATIEMGDYHYKLHDLVPGTQVVKIVNKGAQPHEAPFVALHANTTAREFIDSDSDGAGPGTGVGGLNTIAPGATAYVLMTFETGTRYALICFEGVPGDEERSHYDLGMVHEFTVPTDKSGQSVELPS